MEERVPGRGDLTLIRLKELCHMQMMWYRCGTGVVQVYGGLSTFSSHFSALLSLLSFLQLFIYLLHFFLSFLSYFPFFLSFSPPPSLPSFVPSSLSPSLPTYLPTSLSPSLPTYLPTSLPSSLLCICLSSQFLIYILHFCPVSLARALTPLLRAPREEGGGVRLRAALTLVMA